MTSLEKELISQPGGLEIYHLMSIDEQTAPGTPDSGREGRDDPFERAAVSPNSA